MEEKEKQPTQKKSDNPMREIIIEKLVLNCGGTEDKLERSIKLLEMLSGKKVKQVASSKRIPSFNVRPGLKTGCMVTIRGMEKEALLKRFLEAVETKLREKQITTNQFAFGIKEYLEIPDVEYKREIGILGLEVVVVFKRRGKRIGIRKIKRSKTPIKQDVSKEEIIEYLTNKFQVEVE